MHSSNPKGLFVFHCLAVLLLFFLVGCGDRQPVDPPRADRISESKSAEKKQHGMLLKPVFDETLVELDDTQLKLNPKIVETTQRGGRYFHPVFVDQNTFAVACLRGVDLFSLQDLGKTAKRTKTNLQGKPVEKAATNLNRIKPIKRIETTGHAWSVIPVADTLWVADGYAGVVVLDPATGDQLSTFQELSNARSFHGMEPGEIVVCRHSSGATVVESEDGCVLDSHFDLDVQSRVFSATSQSDDIYLGTLGGGYIKYSLNPGNQSATGNQASTGKQRSTWDLSGEKQWDRQ